MTDVSHETKQKTTSKRKEKYEFDQFAAESVAYYRKMKQSRKKSIDTNNLQLRAIKSERQNQLSITKEMTFGANSLRLTIESSLVVIRNLKNKKKFKSTIPFKIALFLYSLPKPKLIELIVENAEFGDTVEVNWSSLERQIVFNEMPDSSIELNDLTNFSLIWALQEDSYEFTFRLPLFSIHVNQKRVVEFEIKSDFLTSLQEIGFDRFDKYIFGFLYELKRVRENMLCAFKGVPKDNLIIKSNVKFDTLKITDYTFLANYGNNPHFVTVKLIEFKVAVLSWNKEFTFALTLEETQRLLKLGILVSQISIMMRKNLLFDNEKKELDLDRSFIWRLTEAFRTNSEKLKLDYISTAPLISCKLLMPSIEITNLPQHMIFQKQYILDETSLKLIESGEFLASPWKLSLEKSSESKTVRINLKVLKKSTSSNFSALRKEKNINKAN